MRALSEGDRVRVPAEKGLASQRAQIVAVEGGPEGRPIGVLAEDAAGRKTLVWLAEEELVADYYVAVYYSPRVGMFTKVFDEPADFDKNYARDALVVIHRFVRQGSVWEITQVTREDLINAVT